MGRGTAYRKSANAVKIECLEIRALLSGTWTPLENAAPEPVGTMLLLPNGSVMAELGGSSHWGLLTPDASGSYIRGTWTRLADENDSRYAFASQVLPDGRVFVAGGEYGTGGDTGEAYSPLTNTWTELPSQSFGWFSDAESMLLSDGKVLIAPVYPTPNGYTTIFNPSPDASANPWSQGPKLYRGNAAQEQSWVKLADDSVLLTDSNGHSERFIPSTGQWIDVEATVPVDLFDSYSEEGAGILLPDGRAFFIGGTGHTAIYNPADGSWAAGADVLDGLHVDDAPLAMLPDGTVLCAVGPAQGSWNFTGPTYFQIYDPGANAFSRVTAAPSVFSSTVSDTCRMLDLPDGTVLCSNGGSTLYEYSAGTTPLAAAKPTITALTPNGDGSVTLSGTGLNGLDAGAAYGDDAQMDSNYPIVRLASAASGEIYYATTYQWTSTSVATGSLVESTHFTLPLGIPAGTYNVSTIANGVSSETIPLTISMTADNQAPTVAAAVAASPREVTGTTTNLSVLGADDAGESDLVYTWRTASAPAGAALPSFSANGTNSAKNTTVTIHHAGTYTFDVVETDAGGLSVDSVVNVVVDSVVTQISNPRPVYNATSGSSISLGMEALDQFGSAMPQTTLTWSVLSGGGKVSTSGVYTPPDGGTVSTVQASYQSLSAGTQVDVVPFPWSSADVGSPGLSGNAYQDGSGTFIVQGSGSGTISGGTSDSFQFVSQSLTGDGIITARVASQQDTDPSAEAGVMIRGSSNTSDQFALMALTPDGDALLQDRTASGGVASQLTSTAGLAAPYWVRLVRSGSIITGYVSADGNTWINQGSVTLTIGSTVVAGLVVSAGTNSTLNRTTIDNASVVDAPSNFGFETPSFGGGALDDYGYDPAGASWTFTGSAGIAADGSSITMNNPVAPEGNQVAFLEQANATISQQVDLTDGAYAVTFVAAQGAANAASEDFEVLVDGNVVAHIAPSGTEYVSYTTNEFVVWAGTHTIEFLSLNSAGGNNLALIDNVVIKTPTSASLSRISGDGTSDPSQALIFRATVIDATYGYGVPNGETVTLEDASNNYSVLATAALNDDAGLLTVPSGTLTPGTHNLIAVYGGDASYAASESVACPQNVVVSPPTLVGAPIINGDDPNGLYTAAGQSTNGIQRSMVEDIVYTFSFPTTITNANQAFIVVAAGAHPGIAPTTLYAQAVVGSNGTQWAVSLTGQPVGTLASIANGEYSVTINPAYVFAAADGTTSMAAGTGRTDSFYRLYGDVFGTEDVTALDYSLFKQSLTTYNPVFDNYNTGDITALDYSLFKQDLSVSYSADGFVTTI